MPAERMGESKQVSCMTMMVAEHPVLLTTRQCDEVWTNAGCVLTHEHLLHRLWGFTATPTADLTPALESIAWTDQVSEKH